MDIPAAIETKVLFPSSSSEKLFLILKSISGKPWGLAHKNTISLLETNSSIQDAIKAISEKVKSMDEKVFGLDTKQTSVTDSALAYKEELMRKKREREFNGENLDELERGKTTSTKKVGEDK